VRDRWRDNVIAGWSEVAVAPGGPMDDIDEHEKRFKGIARFLEQDRVTLEKARKEKAELTIEFRDAIDDLLEAVRRVDSSDKARTVKELLKEPKKYPDVVEMYELAVKRITETKKRFKTFEKQSKDAKQNAEDFGKAKDALTKDWKNLKDPPPDVPTRFENLWAKYREAERDYKKHLKALSKWKPEKFSKSYWVKYVEDDVIKKPFFESGDDFL
jgi:hypothetical protein